jgi:hypothetical protein
MIIIHLEVLGKQANAAVFSTTAVFDRHSGGGLTPGAG